MKLIEKTLQLNISNVPPRTLFLDIETTGLAPVTSHLYLFGCLWQDQSVWHFKQWLLEDPFEERTALREICGFAAGFDRLITFNGDHFDLPFLHLHASERGLDSPFGPGACSLDLYKVLRPLKKLLGMEHANQKSFEDRIGNIREDKYDGGKLIKVYHDYCRTGDEQLQHLLLLHNEEDVIGMSSLMGLLPYAGLLDPMKDIVTDNTMPSVSLSNASDFALVSILPGDTYPYPVSAKLTNGTGLDIESSVLTLTLPVYTGQLKHFFEPSSDYYYLPGEDMAVHRSVAAYVDPAHRVKATKETCYVKNAGSFIPVYDGQPANIFRFSHDGPAYGLLSDIEKAGPPFWNRLIHSVISEICR